MIYLKALYFITLSLYTIFITKGTDERTILVANFFVLFFLLFVF